MAGKPFFPVGTNYFGTEENGWDFSGPRNALVWEQDFADMERHGVSFVRTGVWMSNAKFVEPLTGEVNERFLRNVEAFLAAAHQHHIAVNFTFFAFVPRMGEQFRSPNAAGPEPPPPNPYLDTAMVRAEQSYVLSVVRRFGRIPWLCYDLINEPSFLQSAHRLSRQRAQRRSGRTRRVAPLAAREICSPRCPRIGMAQSHRISGLLSTACRCPRPRT